MTPDFLVRQSRSGAKVCLDSEDLLVMSKVLGHLNASLPNLYVTSRVMYPKDRMKPVKDFRDSRKAECRKQ